MKINILTPNYQRIPLKIGRISVVGTNAIRPYEVNIEI